MINKDLTRESDAEAKPRKGDDRASQGQCLGSAVQEEEQQIERL